VGHWDVPDLRQVLAESYSLVEQGAISEADFKAWVFDNPYRFYIESNPSFFEGTAVGERLRARAAEARHVIAAE
jgi:hypothetical protein